MGNKEYFQKPFDTVRCHPEERQSRDEGSPNVIRSFANAQDDKKNVAILLVNFGGPRSLKEVKPFLYNLFSDPVILPFSISYLPSPAPLERGSLNFVERPISRLCSFLRQSLAWLITNLRTFITKRMYKKIGGSSPQIEITCLQRDELQKLFNKNELKIDVFVSFQYSKPFTQEVLDEIVKKGYRKLVILPLYPQYSYTTTGSVELVVNDWLRKNKRSEARKESHLFFIKEWYKDDDYIQSFVDLIEKQFGELDLRSTEIIFSAHSIPYFNIKNGDPYEKQIKETSELIIKKLNWGKRWHISYQSKLGPIRWLEPRTDVVIKDIAKRNPNANILVIPISFVSEHVETIYEIDVLYKEVAKSHGIKRFVRTTALNTNKYLIQALYNQVIGCLESNQVDIKDLILLR